jgi:uncharacterized membrane protein YtjA (UPF0391 family)
LTFFIVSMVAELSGFSVIASSAVGTAKILLFIFIVLFATSLILGLLKVKRPIFLKRKL